MKVLSSAEPESTFAFVCFVSSLGVVSLAASYAGAGKGILGAAKRGTGFGFRLAALLPCLGGAGFGGPPNGF